MSEHPNLATALAAFQASLPQIAKDSKAKIDGKDGKQGFTYDYAGLDVVSAAVLPKLAEHGLSFSAKPTIIDGKFVLEYVLRHCEGDEDRGYYPLPSSGPKEVGSAITYARRYALMAVSGVFPGGEDDDGKKAENTRVAPGPHWDPIDQAAERDGWQQEIDSAKTLDELRDTYVRIGAADKVGRLSPNTADHLAQSIAARKAELEQEAKTDDPN